MQPMLDIKKSCQTRLEFVWVKKNVKGGGYVLKKDIGYISIKKVKVVSKLSIAIVTQV